MQSYSLDLAIHINNSQKAFSNLLFAAAWWFFLCLIYSHSTSRCIQPANSALL